MPDQPQSDAPTPDDAAGSEADGALEAPASLQDADDLGSLETDASPATVDEQPAGAEVGEPGADAAAV